MKTILPEQMGALDEKLKTLKNGFDLQRADAFLDELFGLLSAGGHLVCAADDPKKIRVWSDGIVLGGSVIPLARSKMRSLCARLAIRCGEWAGLNISIYGDAVEFDHPNTNQRFKVWFVNRPGEIRIEIKNIPSRNGPSIAREEVSDPNAHA